MLQKAPGIPGLTSVQVQRNFNKDENSYFTLRSNRSYWQIIYINIFSLYNVILIVSAIFAVILKGSKDVFVAVGLVAVNIGVGLFQEIRAKNILDKLATLHTHLVCVRRNGESIAISLQQLVYGDVIEIFPGESIVADGTVLFSDSLELDESSLSGESESVSKKTGDVLTSGAYCLAGFGLMKAEKVGRQSNLYNFTQSAKSFRIPQTNFEKLLEKLFQILLLIIFLLIPVTLINGVSRSLPLSESLTNIVNLVSSLIPQGIIMSITILFAYGVITISKYQALIQRVNAVALMGSITVLCADKTGTLTTNQLTLQEIIPQSGVDLAAVSTQLSLYVQNVSWENKTLQAISRFLSSPDKTEPAPPGKKSEIPFTSDRKWGSIVFDTGTLVLGAPEILTSNEQILHQVSELAKKGLRVITFAKTQALVSTRNSLPGNLNVIALLVFRDQLRKNVQETIDILNRQHIQFKIISGDSAETIQSIARQLHLHHIDVYDQNILQAANEERFCELVEKGRFFARITPVMKERIIIELVKQGEVVAMIGDGVNDVRALKKSHIAITVNDSTQITKDVADMILLNNDFSILPKAIDEGRDIIQRVYAVAKIFFVKVVYLVTVFLFAGLANLAFPISLRQTTWLGFIVVGVPTALIAFKILKPAPTADTEKRLVHYVLTTGILGGFFMVLIMEFVQFFLHENITSSRTLISLFASLYSTFILFQIHGINLLSFTSMKKNLTSFLLIVIIGSIAILFPRTLIQSIFQFADFDYTDWLMLAFGIAGSMVVLNFLLRKIRTVI